MACVPPSFTNNSIPPLLDGSITVAHDMAIKELVSGIDFLVNFGKHLRVSLQSVRLLVRNCLPHQYWKLFARVTKTENMVSKWRKGKSVLYPSAEKY